ncbi:GNAT family N-acetyltransferase [Actinoallomurus sp. CA-150999]|uniref:GNAT family N-acetyltransferase n=1 Tax=Actinoallomurus sp. CA-150999 TaxID=3239887 RepID=UPI003D8AC1CF
MTEITIRGFAPHDAPDLVDAWNRCLPHDPITAGWFRDSVLLDPNFDPEGLRVAVADGQVAGCAYAVRRLTPLAGTDLEPETGWIPFFFVDPRHRRRGVGRRLLDEALGFLRAAGRSRVDFASYTPNYFLPGADAETYPAGYATLRALGFTDLYSPVAMDRSLVGHVTPGDVRALQAARTAEGYDFRPPDDGELPELIRFAGEVFNPDWGEAVRNAVLGGIPRDRILLARTADRLAGFAMYGAYRGIPERFGPFGVDPAERGTGLGKILLHAVMTRMRAEGLHSSWFLWTGEASPAGHLYAKAGYTITRRFHVMRCQLG